MVKNAIYGGFDRCYNRFVKKRANDTRIQEVCLMSYRILTIDPGSTSTKIGVYEDETLLFDKTLRHSAEEIDKFDSIPAQKDWRRKLVMQALDDQGFDVTTLSAVSGRGGLLAPIRGGTYAVSDRLVRDCTVGVQGQHASNLGGLLAREIGDQLGIPSYIVDPVVVTSCPTWPAMPAIPCSIAPASSTP